MNDTCPGCGSTKLIPDLPLLVNVGTADGPAWGTAYVQVQGAPQAWLFKDTALGAVSVTVCSECGRAEMQVANARYLYTKYEAARKPDQGPGAAGEAKPG
jgi:hypothetical protein